MPGYRSASSGGRDAKSTMPKGANTWISWPGSRSMRSDMATPISSPPSRSRPGTSFILRIYIIPSLRFSSRSNSSNCHLAKKCFFVTAGRKPMKPPSSWLENIARKHLARSVLKSSPCTIRFMDEPWPPSRPPARPKSIKALRPYWLAFLMPR